METSDSEVSARRMGKLRAAPEESTESTPLLGSSHQLIQGDVPSTDRDGRRPRRLLVLLSSVFLSTLGFCLLVGLVLFGITYSYSSKISNAVRDEVLGRALVVQGPDRVDVLNATEGSIWVQVDMRVGVDAGSVIDTVLESGNRERLDFGATAIRRALARWLVRRMGRVTVRTEGLSLSSRESSLANVTAPTVSLSLTINHADDMSWLTPLSLPVQVNVTDNSTDLNAFVRESWRSGIVSIDAFVRHVSVRGGSEGEKSWRRRLNVDQDNVFISVQLKVPDLPGLPSPGRDAPLPELSSLVTLESFNVTSVNHSISVRASASLANPLPLSLRMRIPSLPFSVSLSDTNSANAVTVVTGRTEPFSLTHPNITLSLSGTVPLIPPLASPLLSSFMSAYLSGIDAPIVIGSPLLPTLQIATVFPAPHPKPQILRDVQIKDMHISLRGESVLASGMVYARVVLPAGIRVGVDVRRIWPDVLIYDGEVPDDDDDDDDGGAHLFGLVNKYGRPVKPERISNLPKEDASIPKEPLPEPLPPRAFARIRPDDWLAAHNEPIPGTGGAEYEVSAQVEDVPLEVLPGRDNLLRGFITKVIFGGKEGALAGVKGTAAVAVAVDGLPVSDGDGKTGSHVMELTGLPFSGSVRVGRKGL